MLFLSAWKVCFYCALAAYIFGFFLLRCGKDRSAEVFLISGFTIHTIGQLCRGWITGSFILNPIFEEIFFLPWCIALLGILLRYNSGERRIPGLIDVPLFLFLFIALAYPQNIPPPSPKSLTLFSGLFFFFEVMAHACFVVGTWYAMVYLARRNKSPLFTSLITWGFVLYSIAQVIGAVWCFLGWSTPFHWSTRHLGSASIWCYYAAYLHLSYIGKASLKNRAWFAIGGFLLLLVFTFGYQFKNLPLLRGINRA